MGAGTAILATTAFSAASQYVAAKQEQKAYEYNANVIQSQISNIEIAQKINHLRNVNDTQKMVSSQVAAVASSGIEFTGSPIEVINADLARAEFDMAVDNFSFEQEKVRAYNEAQQQRFYGQQARRTGILSAIGKGISGGVTAYAFRGAGESPLGKGKVK
jgi:hypothetical protein